MYGFYYVFNPDLQMDAMGNQIHCYVSAESDVCSTVDDEEAIDATARYMALLMAGFII